MSNKLLIITTAMTTILTMSAGYANPGKGKGSSAIIGYDVINNYCDVEFSSTKDLSNIVIEYAEGSPIKYDNLSGYSTTIPGELLEDATAVYVKSGNNGQRGKKNKGLGQPMGIDFLADVADCFVQVDWGTCTCVEEGEAWAQYLGAPSPQELPAALQSVSIQSSEDEVGGYDILLDNGVHLDVWGDGWHCGVGNSDDSWDISHTDPGGTGLSETSADCRNGLYQLFRQSPPE